MRRSLPLLIASVLVFALAGCDSADRSGEGISRAKELIDKTQKKVSDRQKEFDTTVGKISDEHKKDSAGKGEQEQKGQNN